MIGTYPTPVQFVPELSVGDAKLWVKRDDRTSTIYGGNKVRKLERLLEDAKRRGAERIVTFGAAGSHHVFATTVHGARAGFAVAAVLTPQPYTPHAESTLQASLAWGLEAWPAPSLVSVLPVLARHRRAGDYLVPPGGSNVLGALGYVDAARELAVQIERGEMPAPDTVFVALGSSGTVAGLLAGFARVSFRTKVVAVRVVGPLLAGRWRTVSLAMRAARYEAGGVRRSDVAGQLEVEGRYLGAGYGYPTEKGVRAASDAGLVGLRLEPTYTGKTFAAALDRVRTGAPQVVLYWHTLSGVPAAVPEGRTAPAIPAELRALLRR